MSRMRIFALLMVFWVASCTTKFKEPDEDGTDGNEDGPGDMADDTGQDDGQEPDMDAVDIPDADSLDPPDAVDTAEVEAETGCGNGIVEDDEECDDGNGSNGDGCEENCRFSCTDGSLLAGVVQISSGYLHTCVLLHDGMVRCWGDNTFGQLGNGLTDNTASPVRVVELPERAAAVSAGGLHSCAVMESRGLRCWGQNEDGQLGNGGNDPSPVPVPVTGLDSDVLAVSAGGFHTCAVLQGGALRCWGSNSNGQLGNETTTSSNIPVNVFGLSAGVAAAAAGRTHTCAVMDNGTASCWGSNDDGQLGVGSGDTDDRDVPAAVYSLAGVQSITAKGSGGTTPMSHTCALTDTGRVYCWGANSYGQLGLGSNNPSEIPSMVATGIVLQVSAGGVHTCAIAQGTPDTVLCWGLNSSGQLGLDPESYPQSLTPIPSGYTNPVSAVSSGQLHTCAVDDDEGAHCWGFNDFGQLGAGHFEPVIGPVPVVCR